jgi:hypothetical protein
MEWVDARYKTFAKSCKGVITTWQINSNSCSQCPLKTNLQGQEMYALHNLMQYLMQYDLVSVSRTC